MHWLAGVQGGAQQPSQALPSSPSAPDDWELDPTEIVFNEKIASGAFGDLYKGVYCGQDVAIKILRNVQTDTQQYQEFLQVRSCHACLLLLALTARAPIM